jgi:hypothetical protein
MQISKIFADKEEQAFIKKSAQNPDNLRYLRAKKTNLYKSVDNITPLTSCELFTRIKITQ